MLSFRYLLLHHAYALLFVYGLIVGLGLPIPVDPLFLMVGAMVGDHRYSFLGALGIAIVPAVLGDILWYEIGRRRGRSVLALLCKLSLEPDTCVRKTEGVFARGGVNALLVSKFVPGMSLVAVTLAGISRMSLLHFVLADAAASTIWASAYLGAGWILHRQVEKVIQWLGLLGQRATLVAFSLLVLYIGYKFLQRWLFIRKLRVNRVTPEQVLAMLEAKEPITIVDLRHPGEVDRIGSKIANAMVLRPDEIRSRSGEIPRDHEIILYCT